MTPWAQAPRSTCRETKRAGCSIAITPGLKAAMTSLSQLAAAFRQLELSAQGLV